MDLRHIRNAHVNNEFKVMLVVPKQLITMDILFICEQYWNKYEYRSSFYAQWVKKSICPGLNPYVQSISSTEMIE